VLEPGGSRGPGENWPACSVSKSWIAFREVGWSHGGGEMFALFCFFRRRASQRGMLFLCGGWRGGVLPC
jgi:hypothetical protein